MQYIQKNIRDGDEQFVAEMNAVVVKDAEVIKIWSIGHDILGRLEALCMEAAQNVAAGEVNVGQLLRERYGESEVLSIRFVANPGTLTCANNWDEPTTRLDLQKARPRQLGISPRESSWNQSIHADLE
ncbi:hypothetical protein SmJEL517_g05426 [Synchytrium microbalum]|uniref:Uncharacterized protein n=1 Tax=Synchytrium microbalum TaxID=1806994 RepID=A0A507BP78_9FUNG|nr:uncharacterized protein SmJEL517_g05426 [Synchytrium microbalum]TPX31197.1 hypothetical protein SmJEL517_g05426 [Synchytrium microbalum]